MARHTQYYYIVAHGVNSGTYLLGPYFSEKECRSQAFLKLTGKTDVRDWEIQTFPSRDLSEANRMYKLQRTSTTGTMQEAMSNVRHIIPKNW